MSMQKGATLELAMSDDEGVALHVKVTKEEIQVLGGPSNLDISLQRRPRDNFDAIISVICESAIGLALLTTMEDRLNKLRKPG